MRDANPHFAILINIALDGLEERRFSSTNPEMYDYITTKFQRLPYDDPFIELYEARSDSSSAQR